MQPFVATTFNIHHGRGLDDRVDLARTADVIERTGADLIGLQELDRGMQRSGGVDQPARLAELLGMEIHFFPTLRRRGGEYGIAVGAREGLENLRFAGLPRVGGEEPRGFVVARWRGVDVVVTHLSTHRWSNRLQARALAQVASGLLGPTLVMGDLNADLAARAPFEDAGFTCARTRRGTLARRPGRQLDHLLVSPPLALSRARVVRSRVSDHHPLSAEVSSGL